MKTALKLIVGAIFCNLPVFMVAQQQISACILDSETHKPVELVAVGSSIDNTITNSEGEFTLKTNSSDSIHLYRVGYET